MLRRRLFHSSRARLSSVARHPKGTSSLLVAALLTAALLAGCASTSGPADSGANGEGKPPDREPAASATAPALADARDAYARRHFIQGLTRARLGEHEAAVRQYEKALRAAPEAPAVLSALAEALAAQGDLSTALYQAKQARRFAGKERPEASHYRRQVARLYRRSGQPREALAAYEALADSSSDDGTPPALLAEMLPLYRETGNAAGIERTLKALIRRTPQKRNARRRALARFYRRQDRPEEAAALERRLSPAAANADSARRAASSSGRTAPTESEANTPAQLVERARALRSGESTDGNAERLLRRALRQDSTHAEALALLGQVRLEAGASAEAADLLGRSLEQNPRALECWVQAAQAHLEAGQPARAAATAAEGLLLFPGQLPLLRARATALMRAGQHAEAVRPFEEALRVLETDDRLESADGAAQAARFHESLARLHERLGNAEEAARHRRQARALRERLGTAAN